MVVQAFIPSTWEAQADLCGDQPDLQSEFQGSQGSYTKKPFLKKKTKLNNGDNNNYLRRILLLYFNIKNILINSVLYKAINPYTP